LPCKAAESPILAAKSCCKCREEPAVEEDEQKEVESAALLELANVERVHVAKTSPKSDAVVLPITSPRLACTSPGPPEPKSTQSLVGRLMTSPLVKYATPPLFNVDMST
jgi:hypothetical protein